VSQVLDLDSFAARLDRPGRLIGIDVGTKTLGLAVSDQTRMIATAQETIRRVKFTKDVERLFEMVTIHGVIGIVIGNPINLDGSKGPRAQSTAAFARALLPLTDLPITLWDERLSTVAAERAMLEADMSRKQRAEKIDMVAASIILQGVLDRLGHRARQIPFQDR
jgi:putative Holliday junction resolvase